jgi:Concanavalin A-like lectin/glucanases superfamily
VPVGNVRRRPRGRHALRVLAAGSAALVVTVLAIVVTSAPAAASACAGSSLMSATAASATTLAKTCGKSVLVADAQRPTSIVAADVSGNLTDSEYPWPVQVKSSSGSWVAVSTTLKVNPGGTVSPQASPTPVTLSGGGAGALASEVSGGQMLTWTWPGVTLPKPTLSGSVATYAEVLPGVDLKIIVDEFGFSEVLVVKTHAALSSPNLAKIQFALTGTGVGSANFLLGAAKMWDSAMPSTPMPASTPAVVVADDTVSNLSGPGDGAAVANVATVISGAELTLTPDAAMLANPSTQLPVFIDPQSSSPADTYWAMIDKGHQDQEYWDYDRSEHAKVGDAGDNVNMYRSMFQFSTAAWKNKHVTAATFDDDLDYSWCDVNSSPTPTVTQLHYIPYALGKTVTWNTPGTSWGSALATSSVMNCYQAAGVTAVFSGSAVTAAVAAVNTASSITLGLRAASETISSSGDDGWKKFQESGVNGPHLSVTYNSPPTFTNLKNSVLPCSTSSTAPAIVTTLNGVAPALAVTVGDPDPADTFTGTFTWTTSTGTDHAAYGATTRLAHGATATVTVPVADIPAGATTYHWSVTASDGTDTATSVTCYFQVNNTQPAPPTITSVGNRYPAPSSANPPPQTDGVGKPGQFTLQSPGATSYKWGTTPTPGTTVTASPVGAAVTISYTPPNVGENDIYVQAFTAAGNPSDIGSYQFDVTAPDNPVTHWTLGDWDADDTGTDVTATPPAPHNGTDTNVTWTANGRQIGSTTANFNGTTSTISGAPAVRTDTSFTVSAWVRPSGSKPWSNAVSENGVHTSNFGLGLDGSNHYVFWMHTGDVDPSPPSINVATTTVAAYGRWAFMVGVYDASAQKIMLYVNGALIGSTTMTTPWQATGSLTAGVGRTNDANAYFWSGDVSDVQLWDRVVYANEIAALDAPTLAGAWSLADAPTTGAGTEADATILHPLTSNTVTGGWDDQNFVGDGVFDGTDSIAATTGPVLNTSGSYSVSAWASLADLSGYRAVVSQDDDMAGDQLAGGFKIEADPDVHQWAWVLSDNNTGGYTDETEIEAGTPQLNTWTYLTGVYDASNNLATLYINGVAAGSVTTPTHIWTATGQLTIGRTRWAGNPSDFWSGSIDNVQVFNGALTPTEVTNLYTYGDAFHQ